MNNKSREVVILSASRTPIGTYKGALKNTKADQLGSIVIRDVLKKTNLNPDHRNGAQSRGVKGPLEGITNGKRF